MAKTRARRRSKAGITVPVAVVAGMLPLLEGSYRGWQAGGVNGFVEQFVNRLTGWMPNEKRFEPKLMFGGAVPLVAGCLAHKIIGGKLGVNRALSQAGIPIFRI